MRLRAAFFASTATVAIAMAAAGASAQQAQQAPPSKALDADAPPSSPADQATAAQATPDQPAAPQAPDQAAEGAPAVADIVVTGIRGSLQRSLEIKRNAPQIVDVISADQVGKFPDQNVAESLQRITGVQITRSFGEGAGIAVRGLTQNRVEIDSRSIIGGATGGSVDFTELNPELYGGIEVRKSPTADQIEGALGATINLRTRRPFDFPGFFLSLNARGEYADLARKVEPRISGLVSDRFLDGRLGVLFSASYARRVLRDDGLTTSSWQLVPGTVNYRPNRLEPFVFNRFYNRKNYFGAVEFKASSDLTIGADASLINSEQEGRRYRLDYLLTNAVTPTRVSADGTILAGTYTGVTIRPLGDVQNQDDSFRTYSAHADWNPGRLGVHAEVSRATGKSDLIQVIVTAQPPGAVIGDGKFQTDTVTIDFANNSDLPNTRILTNGRDLNDPNQYVYNQALDTGYTNTNSETAARLDAHLDFASGLLRAIRVGGRYSREEFAIASINSTTASTFEFPTSTRPQFIRPFPFKNTLLEGVGGDFPRTWVSFIAEDEPALATLFGYAGSNRTDYLGSSSVKRSTYAGYGRLDFGGDLGSVGFSGNVGLRYTHLSRTSGGFQPVAGSTTFNPVSTGLKQNYLLPSANLSFELTPKLILRFAAAKVRAEPTLANLSPGLRVAIVTGANTASGGNPNLSAFTSKQADASLEWYFAPGGLLSAAAFYKKVDAFIANTFSNEIIPGFEQYGPISVSRPTNAGSGSVKGIEFGYQHNFTFLPGLLSGLGAQANYTYVDSSTPSIGTTGSLPLTGLSKNSYNLVGFYEKGPVTTRVAYNWRSKYLFTAFGVSGNPEFFEAYGQLDASASFRFGEHVTFSLDASNITGSSTRRYTAVPDRLVYREKTDSRYTAGLRVSF